MPVPATSVPATLGPSSSVAAPGLAPAQYAQLTTQIDAVGTLPQGATGIVSFMVTDRSSVAALRVTADVTLPAGVSYLAAGALGMDSAAPTAPGGWTCVPAPRGATCTHGPLAAGTSTTSYLQVAVAADAPAGPPPAISVGDGGRLVSARGTAGVSAGGFPARFAASGRYAVVTAGASPAGRALGGTGDRCESGAAAWSPARLFSRPLSRPRCPAGAAGAALALPGRVVWAGLYWAWAAGPSHAAVELRGPGGNYQQVTGTAAPGTVTLGAQGLAEITVHQAFAEVTGLVARYGAGAWTAAGPFSRSGSGWDSGSGSGGWAEGVRPEGAWPEGLDARYLGWTLVVVVADRAAPVGQVMVLDGVRQVDAADPYFSASLGGQAAGRAVSARVVAWTADGPEAAAFTRPPAGGGAAVSLAAGAVPYLVGVIAATDSR